MSRYDPINASGLFDVRRACGTALDETEDALPRILEDAEGEMSDAIEARNVLIRARTALRELLAHLDANYEYGGTSDGRGIAEVAVAEGVCNLD
jgi:hypothetical protein